jgi:4-hydroxy-2-oxoheptanedioate aldolase
MSSTVCSTGLSCTSKSNTCLGRLEVGIDDGSAVHAASTHSEGKAMVIVRVPKNDELSLTTALDAGAAGIIIPHVESAQEVKDMMKEMYYRKTPLSFQVPPLSLAAPLGHRSFSPWTFTPGVYDASLYPKDKYNVATSNNHVCIIPQIESVKGIENADEIAAVPGVHALMFGPGDYLIDAGLDLEGALSGQPDPAFLEAMGKFGAAAAKHGLPIFG